MKDGSDSTTVLMKDISQIQVAKVGCGVHIL